MFRPNNQCFPVVKRQKLDGGNNNDSSLKGDSFTLPIHSVKSCLMDELKKYETCIVIGETGCGKTTQIPQFVFEANLHRCGMIAVTQPRRVAAVTVSTRVASEMNVELGSTVGYSVRFDTVCSAETKILYLTDGMLLREALDDPQLRRYNIIVLDEVHERSLQTDVLLSIVKKANHVRKLSGVVGLRVILMSATMDVDRFSEYFQRAPVLYIEGRQFDVKLCYAASAISDVVESSLTTIFQIHRQEDLPGDILVFLSGSEEIDTVVSECRKLIKLMDPNTYRHKLKVFALYAALPIHLQCAVFNTEREDVRKVIVATNIAETSVTIPGIRFVVDSGKVKCRMYDPVRGIDMLKVQCVSQAQACQRSGRAGRDGPGVCLRLYTENAYNSYKENTVPEILRCSLAATVLELLKMKINNFSTQLDLMDRPDKEAFDVAITELKWLGAVQGEPESPTQQSTLQLTSLGSKLAVFPLEPRLARMIFAASENGCLEEMLIVISLLSSEPVMCSPSAKREEAAKCHRRFFAPEGDLITQLNVFREYTSAQHEGNGAAAARERCREGFLSIRSLGNVSSVRKQLKEICTRHNITMESCGRNLSLIRKALCSGLFMNSALLQPDGRYLTVMSKTSAAIHPSSCLFQQKPSCVIYDELVYTTQTYMRQVTVVEPAWLQQAAPAFFSKHSLH